MSAHFRDAADLISVAAARAACEAAVGGRRGRALSWYVAQAGLGVPTKRLARIMRAPGSAIRSAVREIEDRRDAREYDAALTQIEQRAARWAA